METEKQTISIISVKRIFLLMLSALIVLFFSVPSFAGVNFSLGGYYEARALYSENQSEVFYNLPGSPTSNTFQSFAENLEIHAIMSYKNAAILTEFHLTNNYNGTSIGYGDNGWYNLGYTPVPTGFNHDFNTFGLREAYFRLITPIGMWMVGRMPLKFGMGVAVNTQVDGIGDIIPFNSANLGVFVGTLIGSATTAYSNGTAPAPIGNVPPAAYGYSHIQMGTIPTIEVMSLKPMNDVSWSIWLTEAHLNQFGAQLSSIVAGAYSPTTTLSSTSPTANITFGGLSAAYNNGNGTIVNGEFDYFRGHIICSNVAISNGDCSATSNPPGLLVPPSVGNEYDAINSYDLYLTGSQVINGAAVPLTLGVKFGIGAPIAAGHYDMTYYSMLNNTRTLFGDVLGSNWQTIEISSPGLGYIYGPALAAPLSNKWSLMVDLTENLSGGNSFKEAVIHQSWLETKITVPGTNYSTQMFGDRNIGTEFDLDYTHQFTKTIAWQAWGSYVWTGNGVASIVDAPNGQPYSYSMVHKDIFALGSDVSFSF